MQRGLSAQQIAGRADCPLGPLSPAHYGVSPWIAAQYAHPLPPHHRGGRQTSCAAASCSSSVQEPVQRAYGYLESNNRTPSTMQYASSLRPVQDVWKQSGRLLASVRCSASAGPLQQVEPVTDSLGKAGAAAGARCSNGEGDSQASTQHIAATLLPAQAETHTTADHVGEGSEQAQEDPMVLLPQAHSRGPPSADTDAMHDGLDDLFDFTAIPLGQEPPQQPAVPASRPATQQARAQHGTEQRSGRRQGQQQQHQQQQQRHRHAKQPQTPGGPHAPASSRSPAQPPGSNGPPDLGPALASGPLLELQRLRAEREAAGGALLHALITASSWTQLQQLLQRHQADHVEACRQAAVAAAAMAATTAAAAAAQPASVPAPANSLPGQDAERWVGQQQQQGQEQQGGDDAGVQGQALLPPAFSARHLSSALHVTAQLVPDPGALGHGERLALGDWVLALCRGCAALPAGAFAPPDLNMALGALARLVGPVAPGGAGGDVGIPGGRVGAQESGEGEGEAYADHEDGFVGRQLGGRGHYDSELDGEQRGRPEPGAWGGGAGVGGGAGAVAGRGLHASWLDASWVERLLGPTLEQHWEAYEPRHVSGVLWALATLQLRPSPQLLAALCDRAAELCPASPNGDAPSVPSSTALTMTPQGLSLTLWSLARLGFRPHREPLACLLAACEGDMRAVAGAGPGARGGAAGVSCCAQDLSQRVWALATLGLHPGRGWLALAAEALLARGAVEQVSGQSCSNFVWGLARFGYLPDGLTGAVGGSSSSRSGTSGSSNGSSNSSNGIHASEGADAASREQLDDRRASNAAASTSSSSMAASPQQQQGSQQQQSQQRENEDDQGGLLALLGQQLPSMSPQQLAVLLWSLSVLRVRPGAEWLEAFLDAFRRHMSPEDRPGPSPVSLSLPPSRCGPQALAMTACALARMRYRPALGWMVRFTEACRRELPDFTPQAACVLMWSLARLSYRPPTPWAAAFARATLRLLPHTTPLGLSTLLWALAVLRVRRLPKRWLRAACAASARHLRAGAEAWTHAADALELAGVGGAEEGQREARRGRVGAAVGPGAVAPAAGTGTGVLQPEALACMLWAMPRVLRCRPPVQWLAQADGAMQAAVRYTRVAAAAGAQGAQAAGEQQLAHVSAPGAACGMALNPRTLVMTLEGWARLQAPVQDTCWADVLSYLEAAGAAGAVEAEPAAAAAMFAVRRPDGRLRSLHVALALWSCATVQHVPPPEQVERLTQLHWRLLAREAAEGPGAGVGGSGAAAVGAADGSGSSSSSSSRLVHSLMSTQQQHAGMLLWALARFAAAAVQSAAPPPPPPAWLYAALTASEQHMRAVLAHTMAQSQQQQQADGASPGITAQALPPSPPLTVVTVAALAAACTTWRVYPGPEWLAAAAGCLEAGALPCPIVRRRANLESELRVYLERLRALGPEEDSEGEGTAVGRQGEGQVVRRPPPPTVNLDGAWVAGGAVLTNAAAAMAAGSAAAVMQGLLW